MKLNQKEVNRSIDEIKAFMGKFKYSDTKITQFADTATDIFKDYLGNFSEDTQVKYHLRKFLGKVELVILIPGEKYDPFEDADNAAERTLNRTISILQLNPKTDVQYYYKNGCNIITLRISRDTIEERIHQMPTAVALVSALVLGLLCRQLPSGVNEFLTEDLAASVLNTLLQITAGVFGPLMFISLVLAVNALDNIKELTSQGSRIFRCFLRIAVIGTLVSIVTAVIIFPIIGNGDVKFKPSMIVDLILQIVPTNMISPFVDNNFPQMVVLGITMGAALLILDDKTKTLLSFLSEARDWLNEMLHLVTKIMPVVIFLSVFRFVAADKMDVLIKGWKFIVAFYLCMVVLLVLKLVQTSFKCKIGIQTLISKCLPIMKPAFTSSSEFTVMDKVVEVAEKDLGVTHDFMSLWAPLNQAMLAPSVIAGYVIASFFTAELVGMPASAGFILILFMLTVELSMASPGMTAGWTILFHALGIDKDYVGLLSAYRVVTRSGEAAFSIAFRLLEVTQEAYETGNINKEQIKSTGK